MSVAAASLGNAALANAPKQRGGLPWRWDPTSLTSMLCQVGQRGPSAPMESPPKAACSIGHQHPLPPAPAPAPRHSCHTCHTHTPHTHTCHTCHTSPHVYPPRLLHSPTHPPRLPYSLVIRRQIALLRFPNGT
eukprot:60557-Chlamydomonas_euryale.AAC.1